MRTRTLGPAAAAAATLALLVTGCSSSSDSLASATSTASDTATTAVEVDADLAAQVPDEIKERGTLIVASDTSYAPAEFLDEDGQTPIGYDVEIAQALAAKLGLTAEVQTADFAAIIPAISTKYDVGISSFTITAERMEQVTMIQCFTAGEAYAVPAGNPGGIDASDICGLTVGVQTGTVEDEELDTMIADCEAAGKEAITKLPYPKQTDVTTALVGGKADLMYADSPIIGYAIEQTAGQLEQLGDVFANAPQGLVVAKDDTALADVLAEAMQQLIDDGTYGAILEQWGATDGAVDTVVINPDVD